MIQMIDISAPSDALQSQLENGAGENQREIDAGTRMAPPTGPLVWKPIHLQHKKPVKMTEGVQHGGEGVEQCNISHLSVIHGPRGVSRVTLCRTPSLTPLIRFYFHVALSLDSSSPYPRRVANFQN